MKLLLRFFALFLLVTAACAQEPAKESKRAEARAQELRARIDEELSTLGDGHWAGHYYFGDGLGVNVSLDISPKAGFVFEWHGCLGLYDRNFGEVHEKNGQLHLAFELENTQEGFQGLSDAFLPVQWGDRRYLIPSDKVVAFCNAINFGHEPRAGIYGLFLLRREDHKKEVPGFPALPKEYRPYLLSQPITAEIVKVGETSLRPSIADWNFRDTSVFLNAGKKHGVLEGMKFHVFSPDEVIQSARVAKVADDSCVAIISQTDDESSPLPQAGWKLSTSSRFKQQHTAVPD